MTPANVTKIQLSQIASQQGDTITFDVSSIESLASINDAYLIFYLSKNDEYNGYGTVIQLDPQTKQAAIYADLNPEYTYLFYKNDQGHLQSLLWCIEVASRTSDGMFIAHAKSYGRGITEEDLQRYSQVNLPQNQPETARKLNEEYRPAAVNNPGSASPQVDSQSAQADVVASSPDVNAAVQPQVQPQPPVPPAPNPTPVMNNPAAPSVATQTQSNQSTLPSQSLQPTPAAQMQSDQSNQFPQTPSPTAPVMQEPAESAPAQPSTPAVAPLSFVNESNNEEATNENELRLPPLPDKPAATNPLNTQPGVTQPRQPMTADPQSNPNLSSTQSFAGEGSGSVASNAPAAPSMPEGVPDIFSRPMPASDASQPAGRAESTQPRPQEQTAPKQPVGRPPKPLLSDKLWPVSPQDFKWAKSVSRQSIDEFKDELQQKVLQQIRTHKPGLIEDWEFTGEFEKVFSALCVTYETIPSLRHDILKSLLNGRVVESVQRKQQSGRSTPGI